MGSNKNACNLTVCQVVRTKISISKFFDTTHNGMARGKYSTKISISGFFYKIKNSITGGR